MENKNSTEKPRKKIRKILWRVAMSLIVILLLFHIVWINSGSNQWELVRDENEIKIWTLKTPGTKLIKVKAKFQIESTLAGIVKSVEDTTSYADAGMTEDVILIDPISAPGYYSVYTVYKLPMPSPLNRRELVALLTRYQNPKTKKIEINVIAAPNKTEPDDCCIRVLHMHNNYVLTPLENGKVDIEFRHEFDIGGSMPYFVKNAMSPEFLFTMMSDFKKLLSMDKYKKAKLNFIKEL